MEELIGAKIENYKILSILGKGGMGVVFKAKDEKLDRFVAIKFLAFEMVDKPKLAERFKREARNHAQLLHPNIVTVYGFIEYKQLLGIVMEYVEGESLEKVIFRNLRLHIYDLVYIMRQVLLGIGYAHSKGFVHRDIKPSNIILNSEGTVKIMDFGISKSIFDRDMTVTGSKLGTVFYMSPEQIKGSNNINYLSDIYSLGCTMFEMITGQPPFYSDTEYDVMDGHLKKEPPKISDFVPGVPDTLEKIISKCLQKQPEARYKSCGEIIDDFHQLDEYLKTVQSKYFLRKKKNPKVVKLQSIIFLILLFTAFLGLFYFAYTQVDEFIKEKLYEKMDKLKITALWDESNKKFNFSVEEIRVPSTNNLVSGIFTDSQNGIFLGDSALILKTTDGGKSLEKISQTIKYSPVGIEYFNGAYYVLTKNLGLLKYSPDFSNSIKIPFENISTFFKIKIVFGKLFVLTGDGFVLFSSDGEKWNKVNVEKNYPLFDIEQFDQKNGIIVGWNGIVLMTKNGGMTWKEIPKFTQKYLRGASLLKNGTGLVVGAGGSVFRTNDFAENWVEIKNESKFGLTDVYFIDENRVILIGNRGTFLFSENAGFDWNLVDSKKINNFNSLVINYYNKNVYVLGDNGLLLKIKEKI